MILPANCFHRASIVYCLLSLMIMNYDNVVVLNMVLVLHSCFHRTRTTS
jgi:hypothetical protein